MMEILEGYKIFFDDFSSISNSAWSVHYNHGLNVYQDGCGPIAVFKDIWYAYIFLMSIDYMYGGYILVPVKYVRLHHRLFYRSNGPMMMEGFPEGTDFASMIWIDKEGD